MPFLSCGSFAATFSAGYLWFTPPTTFYRCNAAHYTTTRAFATQRMSGLTGPSPHRYALLRFCWLSTSPLPSSGVYASSRLPAYLWFWCNRYCLSSRLYNVLHTCNLYVPTSPKFRYLLWFKRHNICLYRFCACLPACYLRFVLLPGFLDKKEKTVQLLPGPAADSFHLHTL